MNLLLAGTESPLAKAFIKTYKSTYGMVALDPNLADFTQVAPIKDVFATYSFDAVVYFADSQSKNLSLFKNLQYVALLKGVRRMVTCIEINEEIGTFNQLIPSLIEKDSIGAGLKWYQLYGKGLKPKTNKVAALVSEITKKSYAEIEKDENLSLTFIPDAVKLIGLLLQNPLAQSVYEAVPNAPVKLSAVAKAIAKNYEDVSVKVLDKTIDETAHPDNMRLMEAFPKFKFTTLAKGIAEILP